MEKFWLIKDKKNRISGPYNKEEIISYIKQGKFEGEEMCSSYPSGKWKPISAYDIFYDSLLKKMNSKEETDKKNKEENFSEEEEEDKIEPTLIIPIKKEKPKKKQIKINLPDSVHSKKKKAEDPVEEDDSIIEMEDVQSQFLQKLFKAIKLPLVAIFVICAFLYVFFFQSNTTKEDQVHLLTIEKKRNPWPKEELENKRKKAAIYYQKDQITFYLKSQLQLVQILEGNPKDYFSYYYLCLVYLELWPFAYQDTKDRQALSKTLNQINKINRGGIYSGACNSVKALIDNKYKKSLLVSESSLNALNKESPIFFYYLKAKAFKGLNRHNEARNYIRALYNLSPKWIAPYMLDAQMYYEKKNYNQAIRTYQKVLKIYPKQISANLRLGILEYKHLKKISRSEKILKQYLSNLSEVIDPQILLESYQTLKEIYLKQQDNREALFYAKKAYALNPSDNELTVLITRLGSAGDLNKTQIQTRQLIYQGDILVSKGNCEEAIKYYEKAYNSVPQKSALAAIRIAKCLWQSKVSGKAIQWLKKAIKADAKIVEAYFLLVDYLSSKYEFKSALEILNIAQRQNPNSYEIFKAYSLLSFRQKQYKAAISYGERALKFYNSDVGLYVLLNKSYRAIGDYNKAYLYAKRSIEEDINSIPAQIGYSLAMGSAYGFTRGEKYLRELMKKFPLVIEYPQALGEYYFEDEKYEEALNIFLFITKNYPESKIAYMYLGRCYGFLAKREGDKDKHEKAIQYLLKSSLLDISDPEPLFYMGLIYMDRKEYQQAENHYQRVLRLNSNYPLIHYYMGRTNFLQGGDDNLNRALEFAKTESQKNPSLSLVYTLQGDIYKKKALSASNTLDRKRGNYELCAKSYQKAIRLQNKNIKYYIELISCYRGSGDFDSALQIANQITQAEGTSGYPEIYKELGRIYEAKGEYKKAQKVYETYFSLDPSASDRNQIQKRLESYMLK
ncbi:MAG: tetratricopeptide repeat protein [Bdellovibrionales bacterium]